MKKTSSVIIKYLMLNATNGEKLALLPACIGLHKFIERKYVIGLIYLFTFGGFGILATIDLIKMINDEYEGCNLVINKIKCNFCNKTSTQIEPLKKEPIGSVLVNSYKTETEYLRIDGGEYHKIDRKYKTKEFETKYRRYYNCYHCEKMFHKDDT